MNAKSIIAVAAGIAAIVVLVFADVQKWEVSTMIAGMLGSLAGGALAWLAPSPLDKPAPAIADPKADLP